MTLKEVTSAPLTEISKPSSKSLAVASSLSETKSPKVPKKSNGSKTHSRSKKNTAPAIVVIPEIKKEPESERVAKQKAETMVSVEAANEPLKKSGNIEKHSSRSSTKKRSSSKKISVAKPSTHNDSEKIVGSKVNVGEPEQEDKKVQDSLRPIQILSFSCDPSFQNGSEKSSETASVLTQGKDPASSSKKSKRKKSSSSSSKEVTAQSLPTRSKSSSKSSSKSQSLSSPSSPSLKKSSKKGSLHKKSSLIPGNSVNDSNLAESTSSNHQHSHNSAEDDPLPQDQDNSDLSGEDSESDSYELEIEYNQDDSEYICLTEKDIVKQQSATITDVLEVLSIPPAAAIALLQQYKWNKDSLLLSFFDNPQMVLSKAGLSLPPANSSSSSSSSPLLSSPSSSKSLGELSDQSQQFGREYRVQSPPIRALSPVECSICAEETLEVFSLSPCSHVFCNDCWNQYLTMKISEGQAAYINCPHLKCLSLIPDEVVHRLVDERTYRKYRTFLVKSFVDENENLRWCPAPGCGNAITGQMINGIVVFCSCGHRFCFKCMEEAHLPATCEQLRTWKKKCQDESETNNWIAANTQECPKCNLPTEKNGGCNHMTCRQCSYEYCWVCQKDWKGHSDYYDCKKVEKVKIYKLSLGKSKKKGAKEREDALAKRLELKHQLDRYLVYYNRYVNYTRDNETKKIQERALEYMKQITSTEATSAEVKFLKEAADQVTHCRCVLKYSYVMNYFLDDGSSQKALYEYLQEDLEKATEDLAKSFDNPMINKVKIVNLTKLAAARMKTLIESVRSEGGV